MPSSPAESEDALRRLARSYDEAFGAALNGDLDRAAALLGDCESLLLRTGDLDRGHPRTQRLCAEVDAARGRVAAVLEAARELVEHELARVRQGRRMLQGYSDPTLGIGGQFESRA